jgi:hypothetical protein
LAHPVKNGCWLWMPGQEQFREDVRRHLRGYNLACWCPEGWPCHADVLLKVANAEEPKKLPSRPRKVK